MNNIEAYCQRDVEFVQTLPKFRKLWFFGWFVGVTDPKTGKTHWYRQRKFFKENNNKSFCKINSLELKTEI